MGVGAYCAVFSKLPLVPGWRRGLCRPPAAAGRPRARSAQSGNRDGTAGHCTFFVLHWICTQERDNPDLAGGGSLGSSSGGGEEHIHVSAGGRNAGGPNAIDRRILAGLRSLEVEPSTGHRGRGGTCEPRGRA